MACSDKIGFPEGLLGERPVRLDVPARRDGGFIVVNRPAGVFLEPDGSVENPPNIIGAIRAQKGKPELARLGVANPFSVYPDDAELSGASLVASDKGSAAELRNAFGSGMFSFEFLILSERPYGKVSECADLPLLRHAQKPRAVVSHRYGKKCSTSFSLVEDLGDWQLWSAKTSFLRWHQIRIHAAEAGLRPVGDDTYVRVRKIFLSRLKRGQFKGECDSPIYGHVAIHLSRLEFPYAGERVSVEAALPKAFEAMLKKIRAMYR